MENITIYAASGEQLLTIPVLADCYYRNELEGNESVELKWEAYEYQRIDVGSYVVYDNRVFRLTEPHEPSRRAENLFTFSPVFYPSQFHWKKAQACCYTYTGAIDIDIEPTSVSVDIEYAIASRELDWSFKGAFTDALSMLLQSIINETTEVWTVQFPQELGSKLVEITAQGLSIYDMLTQIAEQCDSEFWFENGVNTHIIHIGTLEVEASGEHTEDGRLVLKVGEDVTNPNVQSEAKEFFTRFYFFGSTRNIEQPTSITQSSVVNRRLPLNATKYPQGFIDYDVDPETSYPSGVYTPDLPQYKVFAKSVFFDDIYPRANYKVKAVETATVPVKDDSGKDTNERMPIYFVSLYEASDSSKTPISFKDWVGEKGGVTGDMVAALVPSIAFRSGFLQGLEYEVHYRKAGEKPYQSMQSALQYNCFEVIFDTNSNPRLPNANIRPVAEDECTLFNIKMPQAYITNAENELETKALAYIADEKKDKNTYVVSSNPRIFVTFPALEVANIGTLAKLVYPNGEYVLSRVIAISRHLDIPADCEVTLGYRARQHSIQQLRSVVEDTSSKTETVVKNEKLSQNRINSLHNGYIAQKESFESYFDPNTGQFDGSHIAPSTIETGALQVGARSQQFTLSEVTLACNVVAAGVDNIVTWTSGHLSHLSIDPNRAVTWAIGNGTTTLTQDVLYYIYAKVPRSYNTETGEGASGGTLEVTTSQIQFDDVAGWYYFLLGTISSRLVSSTNEGGISKYTRLFTMTYGLTAINGKTITTGVIQSSDTNHGVRIDLDNGTITGRIRFLSNNTPVDAEEYISQEVNTEISGLGLAGTNLLPIYNFWEQGTTQNESDPSYTYEQMKTASSTRIRTKSNINLDSGEQYTLHCEGVGFTFGIVKLNYGYGAGWGGWQTSAYTFTASGFDSVAVLVAKTNGSAITPDEIGNVKIKLERGSTATEWTLAPEDVSAGISAIDNLEVGGRNLVFDTVTPSRIPESGVATHNYAYKIFTLGGLPFTIGEDLLLTANVEVVSAVSAPRKISCILYNYELNTMQKRMDVPISNGKISVQFTAESSFSNTQDVTLLIYAGLAGYTGDNAIRVSNLKLERGNKQTDWSPAPEEIYPSSNMLPMSASMPAEASGLRGWRASGGTVTHVEVTEPPVAGITGAIRCTNSGSSAARIGIAQDFVDTTIVEGEPLTESFYIRASVDGVRAVTFEPFWKDSSHTAAVAMNMRLTTYWRRVYRTTTAIGGVSGEVSMGYVYAANMPAGAWFEVCGLKVERGIYATAWSEAADDADYEEIMKNGLDVVCNTAAGTAGKVISHKFFTARRLIDSNLKIRVKFTYANTHSNPYLIFQNASGTTIQPSGTNSSCGIRYNGKNSVGQSGFANNEAPKWAAKQIIEFSYLENYTYQSSVHPIYGIVDEPAFKASLLMNNAAQGSTDIDGGLIITTAMLLRNSNRQVSAGINGLSEYGVAFFAGGTLQQAMADIAKVWIKHSGEARFGAIYIDGRNTGDIRMKDADGVVRFTIKNSALTLSSGSRVCNPANTQNNGATNTGTGLSYTTITSSAQISNIFAIGNLNAQGSYEFECKIIVGTLSINVGSVAQGGYYYCDIEFYNGSAWVVAASYKADARESGSVGVSGAVLIQQYRGTADSAGYCKIGLRARYYSLGIGGGTNPSAQVYYTNIQWCYYQDKSKANTQIANNGMCYYLNANNQFVVQRNSGDTQMTTTIKGRVVIVGDGTSYSQISGCVVSSSDRKFKTDIETFDALSILEKLNFVRFHWNELAHEQIGADTTTLNFGLVAQDSKGVIDNFVFDEDENFDYKRVSYVNLIPILGKAINELAAKNAELEARIAELEAKINL